MMTHDRLTLNALLAALRSVHLTDELGALIETLLPRNRAEHRPRSRRGLARCLVRELAAMPPTPGLPRFRARPNPAE